MKTETELQGGWRHRRSRDLCTKLGKKKGGGRSTRHAKGPSPTQTFRKLGRSLSVVSGTRGHQPGYHDAYTGVRPWHLEQARCLLQLILLPERQAFKLFQGHAENLLEVTRRQVSLKRQSTAHLAPGAGEGAGVAFLAPEPHDIVTTPAPAFLIFPLVLSKR